MKHLAKPTTLSHSKSTPLDSAAIKQRDSAPLILTR